MAAPVHRAGIPPVDEIKAIAEEAALYGLPLVMLYGITNEYAIDKGCDEFKAPFNESTNEPRVYRPADTAIVTPSSDTLYSLAWMDLRGEPVVLGVPEMAVGKVSDPQ